MKDYSHVVNRLRKHVPGTEQHLGKRILFWFITIGIGLILLSTIVIGATVAILSIGLPDVSDLEKLAGSQSTVIYDRENKPLYTLHGEENREYVKLEEIATNLQNATIAIEDDQFWTHKGFDITGIARAALYEVFGIGAPSGGSTITQQYVKNAFLSAERSYVRKLKELILALRVERTYDKKTILELYMNRIPYGNNAYGAQKAAEIYFNKPAKDLTLAESVILAAIPQAPTKYNPYGAYKYSQLIEKFSEEELFLRKIKSETDLNTDEFVRGLIGQDVDLGNGTKIYIEGRSDLVLSRMEKLGYATPELSKTTAEEIRKIEFKEFIEDIRAPHFVFYVKQLLEDKYGKDIVEKGGLKVYTTIDPTLQEYAEKVALEQGTYNETTYGTNNAAVLAVNPRNGEILAMVGSRDYFNDDIDGKVNVVIRPRQPGSAFKPIVYAQSFYSGLSPASPIYDVPIKFGSDQPQNYDGSYRGLMTVRTALGQSRNLPAIEAYFLAGSQDKIIELAQKMGINSLDKSHSYGYPLAIGAGEIPLIEMVSAYSTFADAGKKPEFSPILKVLNANGDVIENNVDTPKQFEEVLDPQIAYLITSILSDDSIKLSGNLIFGDYKVATKTGTSTKENKKAAGGKSVAPSDGTAFGYTPNIVVGVWTGNTDGSALKLNADGTSTAAPIMKKVMSKAIELHKYEPFQEPTGIKHVSVSLLSGLLPAANTPPSLIREDVFASFSVPTETDDSLYAVKVDKVSGKLANEYTPVDAIENILFIKHKEMPYENWTIAINNFFADGDPSKLPPAIAESIATNGLKLSFGIPPRETDNVHTAVSAANAPEIKLVSPVANSELEVGNFEAQADFKAKNGVDRVEYYINDELKYTTVTAPYIGNLRISKFMQSNSRNLLRVKIVDKLGYSSEAVVEFKVAPSAK